MTENPDDTDNTSPNRNISLFFNSAELQPFVASSSNFDSEQNTEQMKNHILSLQNENKMFAEQMLEMKR